MATSSPTNGAANPYESPRDPRPLASKFSDRDVELHDLRRRLAELESRLNGSWFTRPSVFLRIAAVWGYFLLGYGILIVLAIFVMGLVRLFTGRWPS